MAFVLSGLLLLGWVGYELWGTGVGTAHAQAVLRASLAHGYPARPIPGRADGIIRIPRIALDMAFVEGIGLDQLAEGPGHYPWTPLPGSGGNVAIAGHRTTHLAPFWSLNTLRQGDLVYLQTREGTFVYQVIWQAVVGPNSMWVTARTPIPALTLTTCNPRFNSTQRLVVRAIQIFGPTGHGFMDDRLQTGVAVDGSVAAQ